MKWNVSATSFSFWQWNMIFEYPCLDKNKKKIKPTKIIYTFMQVYHRTLSTLKKYFKTVLYLKEKYTVFVFLIWLKQIIHEIISIWNIFENTKIRII